MPGVYEIQVLSYLEQDFSNAQDFTFYIVTEYVYTYIIKDESLH